MVQQFKSAQLRRKACPDHSHLIQQSDKTLIIVILGVSNATLCVKCRMSWPHQSSPKIYTTQYASTYHAHCTSSTSYFCLLVYVLSLPWTKCQI